FLLARVEQPVVGIAERCPRARATLARPAKQQLVFTLGISTIDTVECDRAHRNRSLVTVRIVCIAFRTAASTSASVSNRPSRNFSVRFSLAHSVAVQFLSFVQYVTSKRLSRLSYTWRSLVRSR